MAFTREFAHELTEDFQLLHSPGSKFATLLALGMRLQIY